MRNLVSQALLPCLVTTATLLAQGPSRGRDDAAWQKAVAEAPSEIRAALSFLVENMPARDRRELDPAFVLEDAKLAWEAWKSAPWSEQVPESIFLDAILPYAHVTEKREAWRASLRARCLPMIEGITTLAEAAQELNRQLFADTGVRYSTLRKRADQAPSESIEQGLASCTGLSILLADACRAVGVPARLAGIASWPDKGGNHTWVEVWDGETWRFTGAAEYDAQGLDRAWFVGDAAKARRDDPRHAVWAVTWQASGEPFPLVWSADIGVRAVDVTHRYARATALPEDQMRLFVDVRDGKKGPRVQADVEIQEGDGAARRGRSRGEQHDTNDHLEFQVRRGAHVNLQVTAADGRKASLGHVASEAGRELVVVELGAVVPADPTDALRDAAARFFAAALGLPEEANAIVRADEDAARRAVFEAFRSSSLNAARRADFERKVVRTADREAPYTVEVVGERPAEGYPMFLAMHGGGGVPKRVNDQQWQIMQRYYRLPAEEAAYVYVALRAPNDQWNGFYDDAICPMVAELIEQFVLFGDVDPDRVHAMGYSHGGYGAFVIGPKMPDRFASVHASAAAPTPGETVARNLRNVHFTFMCGTEDKAYGRIERCDEFAAAMDALRKADPDGYAGGFARIEGNGHGGLPDRRKILEMLPLERTPSPTRLTWQPSDDRLQDHYWVTVPRPRDGQRIDARWSPGRVDLDTEGVGAMVLWLDSRHLGEDGSISIQRDGFKFESKVSPSAMVLCESMMRRGDPSLAATIRIEVPDTREDR
ncbi:MAG: transglutaminase domain-containing protein [Planctomycetota bacterium]